PNPLPGTQTVYYLDVTSIPAFAIGDAVRAKQTNPSGTGPYTPIAEVTGPPAFTLTLSLDEDGNGGVSPADFEFVGATTVLGAAAPQGKAVFPQCGVWQNVEFSLIPGVEPVISFAGGDGNLNPDGGLYNIDALFFSINTIDPYAGPYDVFVDHLYIIDAGNNEVVLGDAESSNPLPDRRWNSPEWASWDTAVSDLVSYDGYQSCRLQWEFVDAATDNSFIPRPAFPRWPFDDTAKAFGLWLLVEDCPTNGVPPRPTLPGLIIGDAPLITVGGLDPVETISVKLYVDGAPDTSMPVSGVTEVDVAPTATLLLGDQVTATQTTAALGESPPSLPRRVNDPPPPSLPTSLIQGQTTVVLTNVMTDPGATASLVTVYDGTTVLGTAPGGSSVVPVDVTPALVAGQQITATQTVNTLESAKSAPVGVGTGVQRCVVINEVRSEDYGEDQEFVELYNADPDPVDIGNWVLRASDTVAPPGDDNPDYTIPGGTILASGDYYVVGSNLVANVDLVVGTTDLWENENEAIQLLDSNGVVADTVVCELWQGAVAVSPAEGGIWSRIGWIEIDSPTQSWSRWVDGYDTDNNGRDFGWLPATPGATNVQAAAAPLSDNFNGGVAGNDVPGWTGAFETLRYVDPTVAGGANPNEIPASPDGGLAASCVDEAGGGNTCVLDDEARYNTAFSLQIYIAGRGEPAWTPTTFLQGDCWGIGFGTEGSLYRLNDVFPLGEGGQNGNTGLVWRYYRFEDTDELGDGNGLVGDQVLQLVNENDGGADGQVLLDVPEAALTTGWHTLTLTRNYDAYSGSFDSISTNGTVIGNGPSTLFMGYREFASGFPAGSRPPTIDDLVITIPTPPTLGACCFVCDCLELTENECTALDGGSYMGDATNCVDSDANGIADECEALIPPPPTVASPQCDGGGLVAVTGLIPESSEVKVYEGANLIGTASTGGASGVAVFVFPELSAGQVITASQRAGIIESDPSTPVTVTVCADVPPALVINEFAYDDSSGVDDEEFVELYNPTGGPVDIGLWGLRASDTQAPGTDNNPDFFIPVGTTLAADDYYVIGSPLIPNVDLVVGSTDLWEDANEAIELLDSKGRVVDTVIYELFLEATYGPVVVGPAEGGIWGTFRLQTSDLSWARYLDGYDTNNNGRDFGLRPWTPGANNLGAGSAVGNFAMADVDALGLSVGDPHPGLEHGSFRGAEVIDPTVVSELNPSVIPASPQGGYASAHMDVPGGNTVVSTDVITGSGYDLWVYFDTEPYGIGGAESMTFGFKGTTGPYYNWPDPSGVLFADSVGATSNTGVGWLFEKEDSADLVSLKLLDFGDGGDGRDGPMYPMDWILIADIDMHGSTGWHRLGIEYNSLSGNVVARYDDQTFNFTTDTELIGLMYIGYRESLQGYYHRRRPPTFDVVPIVPGDIDEDGDADLDDYALFADCMNGPNVGTPPGGCTAGEFDRSDMDNDNDVDLGDFGEFQGVF
ncbi:MAG: lamin tail domain-containing protein, partial [Phycisphaerales bacterium]